MDSARRKDLMSIMIMTHMSVNEWRLFLACEGNREAGFGIEMAKDWWISVLSILCHLECT